MAAYSSLMNSNECNPWTYDYVQFKQERWRKPRFVVKMGGCGNFIRQQRGGFVIYCHNSEDFYYNDVLRIPMCFNKMGLFVQFLQFPC